MGGSVAEKVPGKVEWGVVEKVPGKERRVVAHLVQDAVVVLLRDADKLAVISHGLHHPLVVQLLHGGRDPKTAHTHTES